ncbi:tetratricopeptide repeat protein [Glycocaulis abyssi]|uniref:Tetratricopeptide repeat protein n=1 Tax=Glycocaulis abyssi TaxID=1433403 RepID=A0ABV9NAJ6_9PROT
MLILVLTLLAQISPEPERSGLIDAYLTNVQAGSADVWLALDAQPSTLTATGSDGRLDVVLEGFACEAREILPPSGRPVTRLQTGPGADGGCTIRLEGEWREAQAFLGEGGVLVALDGVELSAAPLRPVASAGTTSRTPDQAGPAPSGQAQPAPDGARSAGDTAPSSAARPTALAAGGEACAQSASRLEDTPWDLNAMSSHADCLAGSNSTADAITLYERVLAFEPGHYGAALGLARMRAAQGDTAAASALFQTAAESARTDGEALAARHAAEELQ